MITNTPLTIARAILLTMLSMPALSGQVREPDASEAISPTNNIEAMRAWGHPIPPLSSWWIEPPAPQAVARALIAPEKTKDGVCIKRLWINRKIVPGVNVDDALISQLEASPSGPHHLALLSHYYRAKRSSGKADQLMAQAKKQFFQDPWNGFVYFGFRTREVLSAVLALDWIEWEDRKEFEKAFRRVQQLLESGQGAAAPRESPFHTQDGGYWVSESNIEHANMVEELLVLSVYGVNRQGDSHKWAVDRLDHLGNSPLADREALYSSFEFANVLSLISRRGGGREWGQSLTEPPFGNESYFATSGVIQLEAVDTATARKWQLVDRSLYIQTRHIGLMLEHDATVTRAKLAGQDEAILVVLMKLCARHSRNAAGIIRSLLGPPKPNLALLEFRALAGANPKAVTPGSQPITDRVGSRWHYRKNPSKPDSTFRLSITNRDLECFPTPPDERCLSVAIGKVGLVDGHAHLGAVTGALANGVAVCSRSPQGEPNIATSGFGCLYACSHPYFTGKRAIGAIEVVNQPDYLVGNDGPIEFEGKWRWTRDYTDSMIEPNASGTGGKVTLAKFEFEFDPKRRRIEIVDTIRADPSVYVGWHFSPSHRVKLTGNGFRFGDGKDEIRVSIESLDGMALEAKRRTEWLHDGFTLPLEWDAQFPGPKRIAENVGYTPSTYREEYRVRVVIEANPRS
ncbi:MAG: hypothetical protein ACTHK7_04815 [Aureliella sp.]